MTAPVSPAVRLELAEIRGLLIEAQHVAAEVVTPTVHERMLQRALRVALEEIPDGQVSSVMRMVLARYDDAIDRGLQRLARESAPVRARLATAELARRLRDRQRTGTRGGEAFDAGGYQELAAPTGVAAAQQEVM